MPLEQFTGEQPRDIVIGRGLVDQEQVHRKFIYPRSFFAPNQPEPTPPVSTLIIYPIDGGGFFPS